MQHSISISCSSWALSRNWSVNTVPDTQTDAANTHERTPRKAAPPIHADIKGEESENRTGANTAHNHATAACLLQRVQTRGKPITPLHRTQMIGTAPLAFDAATFAGLTVTESARRPSSLALPSANANAQGSGCAGLFLSAPQCRLHHLTWQHSGCKANTSRMWETDAETPSQRPRRVEKTSWSSRKPSTKLLREDRDGVERSSELLFISWGLRGHGADDGDDWEGEEGERRRARISSSSCLWDREQQKYKVRRSETSGVFCTVPRSKSHMWAISTHINNTLRSKNVKEGRWGTNH